MPAVYAVGFTKGFRIGYRKPELWPLASTLLRSLASVAAMVSNGPLLDSILRGDVAASAMLPLARCGNCVKPLVPIRLGAVASALRRAGGRGRKVEYYFTLSAAAELARAFDSAAGMRGRQLVETVAAHLAGAVEVVYAGEDVAVVCGKQETGSLKGVEVVKPRPASEHRNAIDRVTGSAVPFVVTYARATRMLLLLDSPPDLDGHLERTLKLLGELGVGGLRSRGLGRFSLEPVALAPDDVRALNKVRPFRKVASDRYVVALGELSISSDAIEWENSFFDVSIVAGFAGPPYAQITFGPLVVTGVGAVVKVRGGATPRAERLDVGSELAPSTFVFNPLVVAGE
jgi:CRISPR-associated protein Csm4